MALRIVDSQPGKMLTVRELLHGSLQGVLGVAIQIALDISAKTFSQDLGAPLQVFLQTTALH